MPRSDSPTAEHADPVDRAPVDTDPLDTDQPAWLDPDSAQDGVLLEATVRCQVEQNRAHAQRLEAIHAFHARRVAEQAWAAHTTMGQAHPRRPLITPLLETKAEIAPLIGASEQTIEIAIDNTETLKTWFPRLWQRCLTGRLDVYKALACAEQLPWLASDAGRRTYADAMQDWFDKHDPLPTDADDPEAEPLCTLTGDKVRRAARYQRLKLPQRDDQETFAEAFSKRRVNLRVDEQTGMACLTGLVAAHDAITADHRLTLIAQRRAEDPGEVRTLAQLRADSLLDLIHGHLVVPATTGDLEHLEQLEQCDESCRGRSAPPASAPPAGRSPADAGPDTDTTTGEPSTHPCALHPRLLTTGPGGSGGSGGPIGGYARPLVNVTVPISTLAGLDDSPGLLSGGVAIPADYARHLATRPGATWYRLLTDDSGAFLALSTRSYQPTEPIWRTTAARDHTCIWPGCSRPSTQVELDHRTPYPRGQTSTDNLHPLCRRHHRVKHAGGYDVTRNPDGSYSWTTRHGSTFVTPPTVQPTSTTPLTLPQLLRPHPAHDAAPPATPVPAPTSVDLTFAALTSPLEREFAVLIAGHTGERAANL